MAENIKSRKNYRVFNGESWDRMHFVTDTNSVDIYNGKKGETLYSTLGALKGITTSTDVTETGYAADATTVAALNDSLGVDIKLIDGAPHWSERGADTWSPFKSKAGLTDSMGENLLHFLVKNQVMLSHTGYATADVNSHPTILQNLDFSTIKSVDFYVCRSFSSSSNSSNTSYIGISNGSETLSVKASGNGAWKKGSITFANPTEATNKGFIKLGITASNAYTSTFNCYIVGYTTTDGSTYENPPSNITVN